MAGSDDGMIRQNLESRLHEFTSGRLRQRNAMLDLDGIDFETGHRLKQNRANAKHEVTKTVNTHFYRIREEGGSGRPPPPPPTVHLRTDDVTYTYYTSF